MSIDKSLVRHVAKLAAIEISEDELSEFTTDLNDILQYFDNLAEVPTEGIEPTSHVHGQVNAFRDDVTRNSLKSIEIKRNAPDFVGTNFRVPRVIASAK